MTTDPRGPHCQPWCDPTAIPPDADEHICVSATLRQDFGEHGTLDTLSEDLVDTTAMSLVNDPDLGPILAVLLNGIQAGFSLTPGRIHAFAMGLLAKEALLLGDTVAADYYRGEAQRGTVVA